MFFPGFGGGAVGLEAGAAFLTEGGVRGVVVPAVAAAKHAGRCVVNLASVFGLLDFPSLFLCQLRLRELSGEELEQALIFL